MYSSSYQNVVQFYFAAFEKSLIRYERGKGNWKDKKHLHVTKREVYLNTP